MPLTEEQKYNIDREVEEVRDITEYIRENTNIKDELVFNLAYTIYLKGNY